MLMLMLNIVMQAQQFRCAEIAAMYIIIHPDHLEELISQYEKQGCFEELMHLMDNGLNSDRAHIGMYTELATLYAKYKPEKLMDFIKLNVVKLNIPKLIQACERHYHWEHAVYLYTQYDEFDSAANTMMSHSPASFAHDQFIMIVQKASNMELYYRAIQFYLDEQPMLLNSLLSALVSKVDHTRVVQQVRKASHLPLILPYLKNVQSQNIAVVNEAVNEIYEEAEQFEDLRQSIEDFEDFDQIALAQRLEKHELVEMRRIAALVYKKNKRYQQSMELSKGDEMFQDAMETALASGNAELTERLLRFFVDTGRRECFAACLYTCYDLTRSDLALELAWRSGMMDFAMPFMIQRLRDHEDKIELLMKKSQKKEEAEEKEKSAPNDFVPDYFMPAAIGNGMPSLPGFGNLAITGPNPLQPPMQSQMPPMQHGMMRMPAQGF